MFSEKNICECCYVSRFLSDEEKRQYNEGSLTIRTGQDAECHYCGEYESIVCGVHIDARYNEDD
ncbi:hypothetical protein J6A31_09075 [bacterium]|nr:hypothetical protein [bacterium]